MFLFVTALSLICAGGAMAADNAGGPPGGMPEGMSGPPGGGPGGPGGMPGGGMPGGPGGMTEAMMSGAMPGPGGGPGMPGGPEKAAIYIEDGAQNTDKEYEAGKYTGNITSDAKGITIKNLDLTDGDYGFNGVAAKGADTTVTLDNCKIVLGVDAPVEANASGGSATAVSDSATMYIQDSELQVDGAGRYVTSAYGDSKLIINDSSVTSTGMHKNTAAITEPFSNPALLIRGDARANFSIGATDTYYFNSNCTAEGWAALSTDASMGDGLDLFVYNSKGVAENGGYATYADFGCRVWLYGSDLEAGEIGAIISKSGRVLVTDGASAPEDVTRYNTGKTTKKASVVTGGRNAVMIHAPDMMGQGLAAADCGFLDVINGTLATSKRLKTTRDYATHISKAVDAYIDYTMGAALLVKSTSCVVNFDNAKIDSFSDIAVMTVLNSDGMGNFLKDEADGAKVKPIAISMKNMEVKGDIKHMDYQRLMTFSLENATLKGAVVSGTMEDWNSLWAAQNKEDCNWVVDTAWNTRYGVQMTVKKDGVWKVTGASSLSSLTVEKGGTIKGKVQVDGKAVTPKAGQTYTGDIVVTPL
jgi:hypothetical protein